MLNQVTAESYGMRKFDMRPLTAALLVSAVLSQAAFGQAVCVEPESVELTKTLPGSAYLMSLGPGLSIEEPLVFDSGHDAGMWRVTRVLRVTLFRVERSHRMWVEEVYINRAGGAEVRKCSQVWFSELYRQFPGLTRVEPGEVVWVAPDTFDLVDQIQFQGGQPTRESRRLRVRLSETGLFEFSGAE